MDEQRTKMKKLCKPQAFLNSELPTELFVEIFSFCDPKSLIYCIQTCAEWSAIIHHKFFNKSLWKGLYQNNWRDIENMKLTNEDIKEIETKEGKKIDWLQLFKKRYKIMKDARPYSSILGFPNRLSLHWTSGLEHLHMKEFTENKFKFGENPGHFDGDTFIPSSEVEMNWVCYNGRSITLFRDTHTNCYGFFTTRELIKVIEISDRKRRNKDAKKNGEVDAHHIFFEYFEYLEQTKSWQIFWGS